MDDVITFSFTVQNTGNVALSGVTVADQLVAPAGPAVSVSCPASTLARGASMVCTSSPYAVTQADVDAGAVRNTATASGAPPTGAAVVTAPSSTLTPTPGPGITVAKSADLEDHDGDRLADVGETVDYTFVVTNTGATTLRDVEVDDGRLAALGLPVECPTSSLGPGLAMTCTSATYVVVQSDIDAGLVVNLATSTGTTPAGVEVTSPPSTSQVSVDPGGPRPILPATGARVGDALALALALLGLGAIALLLLRRTGAPARQAA